MLGLALVAAGCSGGSAPETGAPAAVPAAPPAPPAAVTTTVDRSQAVYDAYFRHCREFTWQALAYPRPATTLEEAASTYAGPPRQYREPAYRGCLDGLHQSTGRITRPVIKRLVAEELKEDGLG